MAIAVLTSPDCMNAESLARLDDYLAHYRDLFSRSDQARSFGLYLRGLLDGDHRKNVESIAERLGVSHRSADLAQSLQHFVSNSPWPHEPLVARCRDLTAGKAGTIVVHDGVVIKKGRHSVGVRRQFARSIGKKVNCQLAVIVAEVGERWRPLACRLYLPAPWLAENADRLGRALPEAQRQPRSKAEIALELLDEAGVPLGAVQAEEGYRTTPEFVDALRDRGFSLEEGDDAVLRSLDHFEWIREALGFGHFEGRTWLGWHHHWALVMAAHGFLVSESRRVD